MQIDIPECRLACTGVGEADTFKTHAVVGLWATYLTMIFSVSSALGYVRAFLRAVRDRKSAAAASS